MQCFTISFPAAGSRRRFHRIEGGPEGEAQRLAAITQYLGGIRTIDSGDGMFAQGLSSSIPESGSTQQYDYVGRGHAPAVSVVVNNKAVDHTRSLETPSRCLLAC